MSLAEKIDILTREKKRILVLGDIMLDHYEYGEVSRISPEAPVPVVKFLEQQYILGGAANVANNLSSLGAEAILLGVIGNDLNGEIIKDCLDKVNIKTEGIFYDETRPTTVKRRTIAGKHQMLRFDDEKTHSISEELTNQIAQYIASEINKIDAVIISDYKKGTVNNTIASYLIRLSQKQGIPVIVDGKPENVSYYHNVDLIKPNIEEAKKMTGMKDETDISKIAQRLSESLNSNVYVTLGDKGIYIFEKNGNQKLVPSKKVPVYDVTGAGDTVTAVTALGLANKLSLIDTAEIANIAGRIVVQKPGTATLTITELTQAINSAIDSCISVNLNDLSYDEWIVKSKNYLDRYVQETLNISKQKDTSS